MESYTIYVDKLIDGCVGTGGLLGMLFADCDAAQAEAQATHAQKMQAIQ
jgi:hypothetical protein